MHVEVRLFGPLRDAAGVESLSVELPADATLLDAAERVVDDHPDTASRLLSSEGGMTRAVSATVNGEDARGLDGADTALADGDVVRFTPPVVGGRT